MIEINNGLYIDVRHIESLRRGEVRGGFALLYIGMTSGAEHVVEKNWAPIETQILDAKRAADRSGK